MTEPTEHGPLLDSAGLATGWYRVLCDCGWESEPQAAILFAMQVYAQHFSESQLREAKGEVEGLRAERDNARNDAHDWHQKFARVAAQCDRLEHYVEVIRRKGIGCQDAEYQSALAALASSGEGER